MPKCTYNIDYRCPTEPIAKVIVEVDCDFCGASPTIDAAKKAARKKLKKMGRTKKCKVFHPAPTRCSILTAEPSE